MSRLALDITIDSNADILNLTENDVIRALNYWEKQSLLEIKRTNDGTIYDISILNPASDGASANFNFVISPSYVDEKEDFKWIVSIVEKYMERPLSSMDVDVAAFLYDNLHFPSDLIFYLYEYCISKGKKNSKYIEKVAINWAEKGISTVADADNYLAAFNRDYTEVMRAFGLSSAPAPAQKKFIDAWYSYGFSTEIIKEACNRTMIDLNEPNFKYANGILENWRDLGVFTSEDILKADSSHSSRTQDKQPAQASASGTRRKAAPGSKNTFNSYEQRNYSKEELSLIEQQLLGRK